MSKDFQNENEPIGDFKFPVSEERPFPGRRKVFPLFLKGAILLTIGFFVIRCSFFIGADFAQGEISYFSEEWRNSRTGRYRVSTPNITFQTDDGQKVTFRGDVTGDELNYQKGERVSVIYKKNNPKNAMIFSFMGFWFNWLLVCGIVLLVWFGFTVVYYGYGD